MNVLPMIKLFGWEQKIEDKIKEKRDGACIEYHLIDNILSDAQSRIELRLVLESLRQGVYVPGVRAIKVSSTVLTPSSGLYFR